MQKNNSINFVHTLSKNSRFTYSEKNLWNCRIGNSPTHIQARTCAPTHTHATHTRTCAHNLKHTRTAWLNWLIFWFFGEKNFEWRKSIYRFSDCFCSNFFILSFYWNSWFFLQCLAADWNFHVLANVNLHNVTRLERYKKIPVIITFYLERYELF